MVFDIFGKKDSTTTNLTKEISSINFNKILSDSTVFSKYDDPEFETIEYECKLETKFLNTFDTVRIRIGIEKKEIIPSELIPSITFLSKNNKITIQQTAFVVNSVVKECKVKNEDWTNVDEVRIKAGNWRGRFLAQSDDSKFSDNFDIAQIELHEKEGLKLYIINYKKID